MNRLENLYSAIVAEGVDRCLPVGTWGTVVPATSRTPAELLRQRLLSALAADGQSMTTAQLRDQVQASFPGSVVIEAVYRNLTVLERRGEVRRDHQRGRNACWLLATTGLRAEQDRPA